MIFPWLTVRRTDGSSSGSRVRAGAQAGFTLLEVLVVLVILGLLAAVVAGPQIFKYLGTAKSEAAKVQVQQISSALDLYRLEVGRYPTQEEGVIALVEAPAGLSKWNGPYLKKKEAIVDPWGRQFLYKIPGQHGDYDLYTLGADNAQGGNGEDQDITNY
ncbi:MAG: type II secretion system major pseudopilin GspG [Rhodospirillales bacterium]|nr:type II secretion system major pseudopilin GspG [Rhodospirillales bacterium]